MIVMTCLICGKKWTATYPDSAPALECPECGYMNKRIDPLATEGGEDGGW